MQRLKVAISPLLKERYGSEVCWTWRLLLSGIGFAWEEVPLSNPGCDIAYATEHENSPRCRLCVRPNMGSWEKRLARRFVAVAHCDGWSHPAYEGEPHRSEPFHLVDGCLVCERDLIFDVFRLATGQEERYWPKDKHGHFDLSGTVFHREGAQRLALASSIGTGLQKTLTDLGYTAMVSRWPCGTRAAACVGHDVDYPEVVRWIEPLRILRRQGTGGVPAAISVFRGKRGHWHFSSWVAAEQSLDTRSAFYFVARKGSLLQYAAGTPDPFYDVCSRRFKKLFGYLVDKGCEIGMHASYRACESLEKFAAEKQALERASGQKILGNRHHYWRLNPADPESTLALHEQIGLEYDSSLTHERYVGWRRGLSWPFFPFHQATRREIKTLQIPTAWMDDQLVSHRMDNPGDPIEILRALVDRVAEQGGCLCIDVHDYVYDETLFPGWAKTYFELWEYLIARSDFWIGTPGEIAAHWIERYRCIAHSSQGLRDGE